jgi:F0F1-type ATP synthase membrane subunit b/b'
MWFIGWLPDSLLQILIYGILGIGFIATLISLVFINPLLRFMPTLAGSYRMIQVASVFVFLLGVYLWGGYSTEMMWRERAAELDAKAKVAEEKFKEQNAELSKVMVQRDEAVAKKGEVIVRKVDNYIKGDTVEVVREIVKEKNLSEDERKKLESEIDALKKAEKECPIPNLIIQSINEAAKPPVKGDKK